MPNTDALFDVKLNELNPVLLQATKLFGVPKTIGAKYSTVILYK